MCQYVLPLPLCSHPPAHIWALPGDEACPALRAQLARIYDPAEWRGPAADAVPFDLPERCGPCRENICVVRVTGYCAACCPGLECHWYALEGTGGGRRPLQTSPGQLAFRRH